MKNSQYTDSEEEYLIKHYHKYTNKELEKLMGRSSVSIAGKANRLGLVKNPDDENGQMSGVCIDCGKHKESAVITGTYQCDSCHDKLINRLNANQRDIEDYEARIVFLLRESERRNLGQNKNRIIYLMKSGYSDEYILTKNKKTTLWAYDQNKRVFF